MNKSLNLKLSSAARRVGAGGSAKSMDDSRELKISLLVCLMLSGVYVIYELVAEPGGGQPFGHSLGVIGTLLMVSTEVLYSLRKRAAWFRFGPVRYWLSIHIFTGIVGPFMVLMHSAFEFKGLAGFTMGVAVLVVASGFVGRYLYTAIPHSIAGAATSSAELAAQINQIQEAINQLADKRSAAVQTLVMADAKRRRRARGDWSLVFLRGWDDWQYHRNLRRQIRKLEKSEKRKLGDVERLLNQRRNLERQMRMMQAARRLLSVWHIAHVPMGVVLFGSAGVHIVATVVLGAGLWR
ncbi:MAG: hypothetical protein HYZ49_00600 [Chloroflexi bacterium]|nr:hypothetical protein [Chloroflexota bacterium]